VLFKSKGVRAKDNRDAEVVIPIMDTARKIWLRDRLPRDHAWRSLLE
jgi:hypothetical protein